MFEEWQNLPDYDYQLKKYMYDINGNRTAMFFFGQYDSMPSVLYTYDNMNRLSSVTSGDETVTYTYDDNSNLLQTVKADGSIESYTYNNANQLTQKIREIQHKGTVLLC